MPKKAEAEGKYFGIADEILPDYENKGRIIIHIRSKNGKTAGTVSLDPYFNIVEVFQYTPDGKNTIIFSPNSAETRWQGYSVLKDSCKIMKTFPLKECYEDPQQVVRTIKRNYEAVMENLGKLEETVRRGAFPSVYLPVIK